MKKGSDERIPQRRRFSTPVASAQQTPLLRGAFIPRHLQLLRSISRSGIILGILAETNAAVRNNDLAATKETRIKRKGAGAKQDKRGGD